MSEDPLARLAAQGGGGGRRWALYLAALALVGAVVWAAHARIDQRAVAEGALEPLGETRDVAHLEGGVVQEWLIGEGERVAADQPLVRLQLGPRERNLAALRAERAGLVMARARLRAELGEQEFALPTELADTYPDVAASVRQTFARRQETLDERLTARREALNQAEADLAEAEARLAAIEEELALARESLAQAEDLAAEGLLSQFELIEARREVQQLSGRRETVAARLPRLEAAVREAESELADERNRFMTEASQELSRVERELARIDEEIARARQRQERATVRAPVAGIAQDFAVAGAGAVVQPGEPILEVVPAESELIVRARLDPTDRGFVRTGQPATIKVSAYDFVRYGGVAGEVTRIGADTRVDDQDRPYYPVEITPHQGYITAGGERLPLRAGMPVTVDIATGERTVLDYLLRPVLKLRNEAFRER